MYAHWLWERQQLGHTRSTVTPAYSLRGWVGERITRSFLFLPFLNRVSDIRRWHFVLIIKYQHHWAASQVLSERPLWTPAQTFAQFNPCPPSSSQHSHSALHLCYLAAFLLPTVLMTGLDWLASNVQGIPCLLLSNMAGPVSNLISCVVLLGRGEWMLGEPALGLKTR